MGENAKPWTGPSWPLRISKRRPVFIAQTYICHLSKQLQTKLTMYLNHSKLEFGMLHSQLTWKESREPAQITSPLLSVVSEENWVGSGVVKVRKFLYLIKSHARTVPSNDALRTALFPGRKCTAVIEFVCSAKVTKQKPEVAFHTCHTLHKNVFTSHFSFTDNKQI